MGALDDHLVPSIEKPSGNDFPVKSKETFAEAGILYLLAHWVKYTVLIFLGQK